LEFETSGKLRSTSVVAAQKGTTVSVESLFYNLPVRRRELERNIKREWNRVLSVLNQYACIQTGLKLSVSQQPNRGKRMILFSTKGNQTTRENIVNVFGAKTLAVLIPLDLELELEPTHISGQRIKLKTQGDNEAKVIRVRGHVSRPAYGEGRQTPDRQMFFVNGRPCGLPQFAKVFNEVYKSYNSSQSPFIFADIQLDTHLYDVNVSPDKRTILLHDQTQMLDNLRESLSALFESQDYALPTSQLQASKQSLLGKPPPSRHDSEATSKCLASPDVDSHRKSSPADPQVGAEGENTDDTNNNEVEARSRHKLSVSSNTLARAAHGSSLISRWAERKCDFREGAEEKDKMVVQNVEQGSNDLVQDSRRSHSPHDEQEQSLPFIEDSIHDSNRVADFRERLKELRDKKVDEVTDKSTLSNSASSEPPIPALTASTRITDIKSNKAYPSSSAKRTTQEIATITIGDHTVTSIIGSPSKRQRIDGQEGQFSSARKGAKAPVPVPSFNGRLTQMFAAHTERSQANREQIAVTTDTRDESQHSDSSSENLFVDDEAEEESDPECAAHAPSGGKEEERALSPHSQASEPNSEEDSEAEPTPPAYHSDIDDKSDENKATKVDRDVNESIEEAQVPETLMSEESQKRTQSFVKGNTKKKGATYHVQQTLRVDDRFIRDALTLQQGHISRTSSAPRTMLKTDQLDAEDAEETLSLTISKSDFEKMKIIGQFNLGFILASRAAEAGSSETLDRSDKDKDDELFIIDQHATDEKYNFERLQASTVVQSQRLVHPKTLELTAVEEDIVQENIDALERNGFVVSCDDSGDQPVGTRCQLLSLPLSRETTFSLEDLEELISLLRDHPSGSANTIPRPSKVRKMFAMRACRSSVMIGKPLTTKQMEKLVRHMGELDKPWNCPHGRPTMRHLCGLGAWDDLGWKEGDNFDGSRASPVDWAAYLDGGPNLK
jgi:DNA mismatch repair protein PMS2